ncbi:MAG: HD domain-containing phosphohydrolase [Rhodocyclaceae bacterium]
MEKTILLVDDDPAVLGVLKECLRPHYQIRIAINGQKAVELARIFPLPDLILLDVRLPDMAGYEVCASLKQDLLTAQIPVIFLSSHADVVNITHGLELGAVDYVTKPVAPPILLARVQTHLRLRDQSIHLEYLVNERTQDLQAKTAELLLSQELTIVALGSLAETRDNETGNHIQRTRAYVEVMARRLAVLPRYRETVSAAQWEMMWRSAPLHDLGKVGIPDHILLKPGKLTVEEFEVMKRHPVIGRDALRAAEQRTRSHDSILRVACEIAYSHHERWDGTGYPEGMSGEDIPLSARLMALADVYDALICRRVYKAAMPHDVAVEIIRDGRGKHFDPQIVDCFLEDVEEFQCIASRFSDDTPEVKKNE